jgi:hypothetical protein
MKTVREYGRAIKYGQSREIRNIGYTIGRRKKNPKTNTIYQYTHIHTNNVNKT